MGSGTDRTDYPSAVAFIERARDELASHGGDVFVGVLIATAVLERIVAGHSAASVALAATWGVPLLARRRFPVLAPSATLALVGATILLLPITAQDTGGNFLLIVASVGMLAAHNPPGRAAWGLPAVVIALVASSDRLGDAISMTIIVIGAAAAGTVYRRDRGETASLHTRVEVLERTREASLQAAAAAERARIARELHDIVAHSVTVMTVQAGAARMQLARDPVQTAASVTAVEEATGTALAELDRLLGLLGEGEEIRGLPDAGRLVAQMREAGLDIRLRVEGEARPLGGGLDLALYRILQEALTNARKHAGPVAAEVLVRYETEHVQLRVATGLPRSEEGRPVDGRTGHGLIGMRERVAMYGGQLDAGMRAGSFVVDARLPAP